MRGTGEDERLMEKREIETNGKEGDCKLSCWLESSWKRNRDGVRD